MYKLENISELHGLIFICLEREHSYYSLFSTLIPKMQVDEQQCLISLSLNFCTNCSHGANIGREIRSESISRNPVT